MSEEVNAMFSSIANRYDLTNDVLSLGMHRLWRRPLLDFGGIRSGHHVLDLCTGTGDVAFCLQRRVGGTGSVIGLDFVPRMIEIAKAKAMKRSNGAQTGPSFMLGDAMHIPFADRSFDAVTIAFGIRNLDNPLLGLIEMKRVLKKGGKVAVLEFGQPYVPVFSDVYGMYAKHLMPAIGGALTGNRRAYEYLPKTSAAFPAGASFTKLLAEAGFAEPQFRPLLGGLAYLYRGTVPD